VSDLQGSGCPQEVLWWQRRVDRQTILGTRLVVGSVAVQRLIQATISSHGSAREQLASYLEGFARQMEAEPTLFLVLAEFALRARRDSALSRVLQANLTGQKTFLIQTLQAGMREGTWDQHLDPEATAMAISCFLQGVGSRLPLTQPLHRPCKLPGSRLRASVSLDILMDRPGRPMTAQLLC